MHIQAVERIGTFCRLTKDTKESLDALAKYNSTTWNNLIEEGAHHVIRTRIKQIYGNQYDTQKAKELSNHW